MTNQATKSVLTPDEVAEILRLDVGTVRELLREKHLRGFKVRARWRIRREALEAFMTDHQEDDGDGSDSDRDEDV